MRKDHSILITTHYMEEAEALADKIAIISNGQLLCYGPSIQLKRKLETGYILKLLTNDSFNQNATMDHIKQFVPDASIKVNNKFITTFLVNFKIDLRTLNKLKLIYPFYIYCSHLFVQQSQ